MRTVLATSIGSFGESLKFGKSAKIGRSTKFAELRFKIENFVNFFFHSLLRVLDVLFHFCREDFFDKGLSKHRIVRLDQFLKQVINHANFSSRTFDFATSTITKFRISYSITLMLCNHIFQLRIEVLETTFHRIAIFIFQLKFLIKNFKNTRKKPYARSDRYPQ